MKCFDRKSHGHVDDFERFMNMLFWGSSFCPVNLFENYKFSDDVYKTCQQIAIRSLGRLKATLMLSTMGQMFIARWKISICQAIALEAKKRVVTKSLSLIGLLGLSPFEQKSLPSFGMGCSLSV